VADDVEPKPQKESVDPDETDSAPGQPDDATEGDSTVPNYSVSPRRVAMFAVSIASASLTTLAVVASVEGVDALTTIALVLAIVAFTIQIFLFVVQSQGASEQRVRSEQINTQTRALLAEVRTTALATQGMVTQQFNQLLQAFVTGTVQTAEETKFDPVRLEQRFLANVRAAMQQPPTTGPSGATGPSGPTTGPTGSAGPTGSSSAEAQEPRPPARAAQRPTAGEAQRRARQRHVRPVLLKTFPTEAEGRSAVTRLKGMSADERQRLRDLASDEITASEGGAYVGLNATPSDVGLEAAGLVSKARVDVGRSDPIEVSRLTAEGVKIARPLTALGDIPAWARDLPADPPDVDPDDDIPF